MPVTRNGLPSTPSNSKHVLPDRLLSMVMIVWSIPAPWMVMAFTLGEWPECQPFFDQMAVPAGSWTMSPSLAASIAFPTASGVKSAALRVSAPAVLGSNPSAAMRGKKAEQPSESCVFNSHRRISGCRLHVLSWRPLYFGRAGEGAAQGQQALEEAAWQRFCSGEQKPAAHPRDSGLPSSSRTAAPRPAVSTAPPSLANCDLGGFHYLPSCLDGCGLRASPSRWAESRRRSPLSPAVPGFVYTLLNQPLAS